MRFLSIAKLCDFFFLLGGEGRERKVSVKDGMEWKRMGKVCMGAYSQADDAAGQRVRQAAELAAAAVQQLSPARAAGRAGARRLQGNGGRDRRAEQSERRAEQQQQGRAQRPAPHPRHPSLLSYCFPQPPSFSL